MEVLFFFNLQIMIELEVIGSFKTLLGSEVTAG